MVGLVLGGESLGNHWAGTWTNVELPLRAALPVGFGVTLGPALGLGVHWAWALVLRSHSGQHFASGIGGDARVSTGEKALGNHWATPLGPALAISLERVGPAVTVDSMELQERLGPVLGQHWVHHWVKHFSVGTSDITHLQHYQWDYRSYAGQHSEHWENR
jgi:hypothetical protein